MSRSWQLGVRHPQELWGCSKHLRWDVSTCSLNMDQNQSRAKAEVVKVRTYLLSLGGNGITTHASGFARKHALYAVHVT